MNISRQQIVVIALGALVLAVSSAAVGYWFAKPRSEPSNTRVADAEARRPLNWYDPMKPNQHFDKPGKSPFMDMQLVPKYADEKRGPETEGLTFDPRTVQNLGIRLARVEIGSLPQSIDAVGTVGFNQRDIAIIQARRDGFITRVYARAPGDVIAKNAPIVDMLVPEWAGAQTEFLALLKSGDHDLIEAARQRLVLLGMPGELIAHIETDRELRTTVTIRSPLAGMIDMLEAREGMTVGTGATLAKINGLSAVWIEAAVPEIQGDLARLGRQVKVRLSAYPGHAFTGRVIGVLPQTNSETRTARVRIELGNPGGRLRPGMFAQVRLDYGKQAPVLYVTSEAVIRTGTRDLVIVATEGNRFIPKEVQTGADVGGKTVIVKGLSDGQTVVATGQFLIDSEASLQGVLTRLAGAKSEHDSEAAMPGSHP